MRNKSFGVASAIPCHHVGPPLHHPIYWVFFSLPFVGFFQASVNTLKYMYAISVLFLLLFFFSPEVNIYLCAISFDCITYFHVGYLGRRFEFFQRRFAPEGVPTLINSVPSRSRRALFGTRFVDPPYTPP